MFGTLVVSTVFIFTLPGVFPKLEQKPFDCTLQKDLVTNCKVPYNSSMIVLNCPGGNTVAKWKHTLRNQNYTICSESLNRTCIVKGYEGRLSNDDSGSYYCIIAEDDIRRAVVTVLAPPQLINVFNVPNQCTPPVVRDHCKTTNMTYEPTGSFTLVVVYFSVDHATVRWFLNETEIHCSPANYDPHHHYCISSSTKPGKSQITINAQDDSVSGVYRAVVSNAYGSNETLTFVYKSACEPPAGTHPISVKNRYYNVTVGEAMDISEACQLRAPLGVSQTICFTHNLNATFEEVIASYNNCARCYDSDAISSGECTFQFTNNDDYLVTASYELCTGVTSISFLSRFNTITSYADSGKIFCSYPAFPDMLLYTTVHVRVVEKPPPDRLLVKTVVPAGFVVLVLLVMVIVSSALGYKYRAKLRATSKYPRIRSMQRREKALLIERKGSKDVKRSVSSKPRSGRKSYGAINTHDSTDPTATTDACLTEEQSDFPSDAVLPTSNELAAV